ncbi:MAG: PD-(D/E)XK nuclease-like domain-containing protein [Planctomycetota bacterium]
MRSLGPTGRSPGSGVRIVGPPLYAKEIEMESQTLDQLDFECYRQIDRMNASTLVHGCKSMLSLKRAIDWPKDEPTSAMQFGHKYHSLILEPEDFERRFCVMPNYSVMPENVTAKKAPTTSWATKFCKDSKAKFIAEAESSGQEVITREEYDRGLAMCEAIAENEMASELITTARKEVTLLGEISGIPFKCRIDLLGESFIADLKGTANAAPVAFGRSAANLRYGFKLSIYREVFRQNFLSMADVFLVAVESAGDFDCCVYQVPDAVLDQGISDAVRVIDQFKECQASGNWPGVDRGEAPVQLYVPNWAMPEDDAVDWEAVQ